MSGDEAPTPEFHLADAVELVRSELSRARLSCTKTGPRGLNWGFKLLFDTR